MKNNIKFDINKSHINLFLKDIYKDIRKIEVFKEDEKTIIRRYSDGVVSVKDEVYILNQLCSIKERNWFIPRILKTTDKYIDFKYIEGIRLFNFLIELKYLYEIEQSKKALDLAEIIKEITISHLYNFQEKVKELSFNTYNYPVKEKLLAPITLLCESTSFSYNSSEIENDLNIISKHYNSISDSLFRDASPKNIIFDEPSLYYNNFRNHKERRNKIRSLVNSGYFTEKVIFDNLYHIDFTGCKYKCPAIDDFIATNMHECNIWMPSSQRFFQSNKKDLDFLVTLFVRYLRFGGRKLSYRIYNSYGHKIRFQFDYEKLYFEQLSNLSDYLPKIINVKGTELKRIFDYFSLLSDLNLDVDYLSKYFDYSDIRYYSGLFPSE